MHARRSLYLFSPFCQRIQVFFTQPHTQRTDAEHTTILDIHSTITMDAKQGTQCAWNCPRTYTQTHTHIHPNTHTHHNCTCCHVCCGCACPALKPAAAADPAAAAAAVNAPAAGSEVKKSLLLNTLDSATLTSW